MTHPDHLPPPPWQDPDFLWFVAAGFLAGTALVALALWCLASP